MDLKKIIISRTDSIGDVMLTLPMCVWLKENYPNATLTYLCRKYTKPVVDCFDVIDEVIEWDEMENLPTVERIQLFKSLEADAIIHVFPNKEIASLAKKVRIPMRVGTSHRTFHLLSCTHKVNFTRKKSPLHESQLNFELLRPFGLKEIPKLEDLSSKVLHFELPKITLGKELLDVLNNGRPSVALHPKSQGSAVEWPMENYLELAEKLVVKGYNVFFTGTENEGKQFKEKLRDREHVHDLSGRLSLKELIVFISELQVFVACSTGPLHIAGFLGVKTIGLFSPRIPIHPGRWQPLGNEVYVLVFNPNCPTCKKKKSCDCIESIQVADVLKEID